MKIKNLVLLNYQANFNQILHKASLDEGDSRIYRYRTFNSQWDDFSSSPYKRYDIIIALFKCVYWFKLVFQVSDIAHGTFVTFCIALGSDTKWNSLAYFRALQILHTRSFFGTLAVLLHETEIHTRFLCDNHIACKTGSIVSILYKFLQIGTHTFVTWFKCNWQKF